MFKSLRRKLIKNKLTERVIAYLAYLYMELVYFTGRWQHVNRQAAEKFWDAGQPMIVCFWHNRLLSMCRCWRMGTKAEILISRHRDGKLISSVIGHYGIGTVVGSTSHGSAAAMREMLDKVAAGVCIGITPDGPRGPRYCAAPGAVYLAKMTGLPIVNISVATTRRRVLKTWDRFIVTLPFSRGVYIWGDPIYVPPDADETELEKFRVKFEQDLRDVTDRSDIMCGHAPIALQQ